MFLRLAGQVEGQGRDEDALAYWRDEREFRNLQIVELPNGDFGFTIVRQFLFSAFSHFLLEKLSGSSHADLAAIAAKAAKETRYHVRHAAEWVVRLGDGTEESHARAQAALDELWPWTGEFFQARRRRSRTRGVAASAPTSKVCAGRGRPWSASSSRVRRSQVPDVPMRMTGGRKGRHTEHLGHMLAEMQIVARSHPGAKW